MAEWQVTCIVKRGNHFNPHERISHIGNQQQAWMMTEDAAIRTVEAGTERFFTLVNNRRAEVIVATHIGRKYLKTTADGYSPDNLLALAECSGCKVVA